MQQLTGVDASFLNMETGTVFGHVASLTIYDPASVPGANLYEATKQSIAERIHLMPLFRRRLVEVPFGLDLPYWIEDPDFDLDFHVRHHAVPPPGDERQLGETVARIIARPLDRSRPLWELYVIEGLEGGLVAELTKIHHATIDGASGAELLTILLDREPGGATVEPPTSVWVPDRVPDQAQLMRKTAGEFLRRPEKLIRLSVRTMREMAKATQNGGLAAMADVIAQPLPGPVGDLMRRRLRAQSGTEIDKPPALPPTAAPHTPWNKAISPHRRFAFTTVSLADAKKIRKTFGTTINDVVLALCSDTLRRYLASRGELPAESLIASCPVSLRTGGESETYSNRVSMVMTNLYSNIDDPVERLKAISGSMRSAKEMHDAMPAEVLQDFTQFAPPAVLARAARVASRLKIADRMNPPFNLIISNVPGPSTPLYLGGALLKHFYPVSAVAEGQGLNITVQSYLGNLDFGFVSCRELVPDLWDMCDHMQAAMAELTKAAEAAA